MDISALGENPAFWLVLVYATAQIAWSQREKLGALFGRKVEVGIRRDEADLRFEDAAKERLLENGQYSRELVSVVLQLYEAERIERKTMTDIVIQQARSTERLASEAVEVMRDFANIARDMVNRGGHDHDHDQG